MGIHCGAEKDTEGYYSAKLVRDNEAPASEREEVVGWERLCRTAAGHTSSPVIARDHA
eukprot:COSAG02_NODE_6407_length_3594_cov_1.077825_1_plen_58_part_00